MPRLIDYGLSDAPDWRRMTVAEARADFSRRNEEQRAAAHAALDALFDENAAVQAAQFLLMERDAQGLPQH